jgi:hypothetical protein
VGIAWWNNRQFCLHQAEIHRLQTDVATNQAGHLEDAIWHGPGMDNDSYRAAHEESVSNRSSAQNHARLAEDYEAAVWQPWLRLFIIDDAPQPRRLSRN